MRNNNIVNKKNLHHFPFNYRKLKIQRMKKTCDNPLIQKAGKITTIQNENAYLEDFYKSISLII
jgi:hypothetical protein